MWVVDYRDDIECDFLAIYGKEAEWFDTCSKYLKYASRLPKYPNSAVRATMLADQEAETASDTEYGYGYADYSDTSGDFAPGQSMSMSEALSRSTGSSPDIAAMETLNREGMRSNMGALFEYETA